MIPKSRVCLWSQRGITGLETAIVLIGFVVVSSVFAFAALSTGLFASDKAKETISAGLAGKRSTLEVKGSVILAASTTGSSGVVSQIRFELGLAAAGDAVDLTPGNTVIRYTDDNQSKIFATTANFSSANIATFGDSDGLLEMGELFEIKLLSLDSLLTTALGPNSGFSVEVIPPVGAAMYFNRRTPVSLQSIETLD